MLALCVTTESLFASCVCSDGWYVPLTMEGESMKGYSGQVTGFDDRGDLQGDLQVCSSMQNTRTSAMRVRLLEATAVNSHTDVFDAGDPCTRCVGVHGEVDADPWHTLSSSC